MTSGQFRMHRRKVAGVEAVEADTRHTFARHTHEQFGIGVIHRGAQRSLSGRGEVEAGPGDTITVNPGEVHDGAPIGDRGRSWRMLYFDPAVVADAVLDIGAGGTAGREFSRPVIRSAALAERFGELFSILTAQGDELRREELSLSVLAEAMREHAGDDRKRPVPAAVAITRTLIDDDPAAPVTLADLARECGLSRFQVLRAFARATGLTPHAYLVQRRIDVARRLIAQGTPLAEAAAASGFADQSHMTRTFVRKYGLSPGAYAGASISSPMHRERKGPAA
ncbi:AraC family transcriptional regulator [Arenibaculum sp.]|uniref:AraC family transcriptional regulator n=1 Tax=Arenibaculum sp. TaxID=2865862 RepID=UPI002E0E2133|nr:AraC family transcriptional regulator [Arenibaculum sp.]